MKKKPVLLTSVILAVCVIAVAVVLWFTKGSFTMNTETLRIGAVDLGTTTVTADLTELTELLDGQKWTCLLGGVNSIPISDDTIMIDGAHDDAPAHFVLDPDRALFYRSADGPFSFYTLENPEQLYQQVRSLINQNP